MQTAKRTKVLEGHDLDSPHRRAVLDPTSRRRRQALRLFKPRSMMRYANTAFGKFLPPMARPEHCDRASLECTLERKSPQQNLGPPLPTGPRLFAAPLNLIRPSATNLSLGGLQGPVQNAAGHVFRAGGVLYGENPRECWRQVEARRLRDLAPSPSCLPDYLQGHCSRRASVTPTTRGKVHFSGFLSAQFRKTWTSSRGDMIGSV
jgi:hypothetical protein